MDDLPDYELQRTAGGPSPVATPRARSAGMWMAVGALIVAAAAAAYVVFGRPFRRAAPAAPAQPPAAAKAAPPASLGREAEPIALPPLDESDALVRTLVRALSTHPAVTAWLTTSGLIRNFTVVIANIADGATPARQLTVLRPSTSFRVVERDGIPYLDERSDGRYAAIADAVASIDPAGAARLYATLKPRIAEAYRDLGFPDQPFDRTLARAIVTLLGTPILDGPVRLKPKGIGYAFADERLEAMTGAQKQLLRMGPQHVRTIEGRLRAIALALGLRAAEPPGR